MGLRIRQTADGFELVDPPGRQLATSSFENAPDAPLFNFHFKDFKRFDWTLFVDSVSRFEMRGTWFNSKDIVEESDSWTASGTGADQPGDEDEARAASAK
jgi:hypothetical protein